HRISRVLENNGRSARARFPDDRYIERRRVTKLISQRIRNTKNSVLAMVAAMPATPKNPRAAAISATIRKIRVQCNIVPTSASLLAISAPNFPISFPRIIPIMAVPNYSVLKGDPQAGTVSGKNPHFRIPVNTFSGMFTIDVNVESTDGSEVLYLIHQDFTPPDAEALGALSTGVTGLEREPGGLALDYVRERVNGAPLVIHSQMSVLPIGGGTMKNQVA